MLARFGMAVPQSLKVSNASDVDAVFGKLKPPVVLKIMSPDILHKSDAGGVKVGLKSADEVKAAINAMTESPQIKGARIDGYLIEEMAPAGQEIVIGGLRDPNFGPLVMVGLGGVLTEVLHDVAHRFAPLTPDDAREMLAQLKGAKILDGYRGAPSADVDAVVDVLVRLSWLISDHKERIAEIDVNPLFVRAKGKGVVAADALVVLR